MVEEIIKICLNKNLNFSAFSFPKSNKFEIVIENPLTKNHSDSGFILHPFDEKGHYQKAFIPNDFHFYSDSISVRDIESIKELPTINTSYTHPIPSEITKPDYLQYLSQGINKMENEKIDKFIFSRVKHLNTSSNLDLSKYLFQLNKNAKSAFVYLANHEITGMWMGASPETLISWNQSIVRTMALAGTQPITNVAPNWSEKEIEEHNYVVNYIENCFKSSDVEFTTSSTETLKTSSVYHLHTPISSIKEISFSQAMKLVNELHPTPAICGVPLEDSKKLIVEIENYDRSYYTGYIGFMKPNEKIDFFVNLRCLQVFPKKLALYVGGGITKKSIPELEWDETEHKSKTLEIPLIQTQE